MIRIAVALMLATSMILHADAVSDWQEILALDAGPRRKPASREEAVLLARNHLLLQKRTLEAFLQKYPRDGKAPSAKFRLAGILATQGSMDANPAAMRTALANLEALGKDPATPWDVRADAAFRRASILMQTQDASTRAGREGIVSAAREFAGDFPGDVRGPRLLVEAATVCDPEPETKRALLDAADRLTTEEPLKRRIADDRTRLALLGEFLDLEVAGLDGKNIHLASLRGEPTVIIFWSSEAPQSLVWLRDFGAAWLRLGKRAPQVLTISLDKSQSTAADMAREFPPQWHTAWESGGWQAPTARRLGINALPTVWVVDRTGRLVSLSAKTDWERLTIQP